jgi:NAD kinase
MTNQQGGKEEKNPKEKNKRQRDFVKAVPSIKLVHRNSSSSSTRPLHCTSTKRLHRTRPERESKKEDMCDQQTTQKRRRIGYANVDVSDESLMD